MTAREAPSEYLYGAVTPDCVLGASSGVEAVQLEDGRSVCAHVRHVEIAGEIWTFALERFTSAHEDTMHLHEDVDLLDPRGRAVARLEQFDLDQVPDTTRLRVRRFRLTSLPGGGGAPAPGLCIETTEEIGPGFDGDWSERDEDHQPWRPRRRYRAADAWRLETDGDTATLRRAAAYDALCPPGGYARFVDVGPREMSIIERRRLIGEVRLPDARTPPPTPWRVPWWRGRPITLAEVRRAFPGHARYWSTHARTGEEPNVPVLCAGPAVSAETCIVRVELLARRERVHMGLPPSRAGRFASVRVRDPAYQTGLHGVHVGARYLELAPRLERCERAELGPPTCGVVGAAGLRVELEVGDEEGSLACDPDAWASCPALESATITALVLAPTRP